LFLEAGKQGIEVGIPIDRQYPVGGMGEIAEHAVFAPRSFEKWLYGYSECGSDGIEFLRNTAWVGEVGNDKTGEMGKCPDGFGEVAATRFLKVEQDGQVSVSTEFVSQCVQHSFPFRGEATKNEHGFLRNGVDDLTDFLVVQEQVDKLSHLEVINSDGRLIFRDDD